MSIDYIDIGSRIRNGRKRKNMPQEKLAELAALSVQHLSGIENGKTKFSFQSIVRIANVLEISMDELLCGSLVQGKAVMQNEYAEMLADCSPDEVKLIIDLTKVIKRSIREKRTEVRLDAS